MFVDYSIPLNGILKAESSFNRVAGQVAVANLPSAEDPADSFALTDLAAEIIEINRAKATIEANLQVVSTLQELEHEILELFG